MAGGRYMDTLGLSLPGAYFGGGLIANTACPAGVFTQFIGISMQTPLPSDDGTYIGLVDLVLDMQSGATPPTALQFRVSWSFGAPVTTTYPPFLIGGGAIHWPLILPLWVNLGAIVLSPLTGFTVALACNPTTNPITISPNGDSLASACAWRRAD